MSVKNYDTFIIGHISLDEIIYNGQINKTYGGAVLASSYAAAAGGAKTGIFTKIPQNHEEQLEIFNISQENIYYTYTEKSTSIRNEYLSCDKERRICTALSIASQFKVDELPSIKSKIYHLAGLIAGDYEEQIIKYLSQKGKVALDVQGVLRQAIKGKMLFKDWKNKKEFLPYINFLKTDAAEAEIMTGYVDRKEAAKKLYSWGAKEIMITYNTDVLVYDGEKFYSAPLKPRNLSGRTGRGDTCFSAYITERLKKEIDESVVYAAALVSLKMENPGPFKGTRKDVEEYIKKFY